jgi:hypothetical protein
MKLKEDREEIAPFLAEVSALKVTQANSGLITCTGTFNQEERAHEERMGVYAELKESQN